MGVDPAGHESHATAVRVEFYSVSPQSAQFTPDRAPAKAGTAGGEVREAGPRRSRGPRPELPFRFRTSQPCHNVSPPVRRA